MSAIHTGNLLLINLYTPQAQRTFSTFSLSPLFQCLWSTFTSHSDVSITLPSLLKRCLSICTIKIFWFSAQWISKSCCLNQFTIHPANLINPYMMDCKNDPNECHTMLSAWKRIIVVWYMLIAGKSWGRQSQIPVDLEIGEQHSPFRCFPGVWQIKTIVLGSQSFKRNSALLKWLMDNLLPPGSERRRGRFTGTWSGRWPGKRS